MGFVKGQQIAPHVLEKRREHYDRQREAFLEEYAFFRSFGWDDSQIARKLGIKRHVLLMKLRRLGVDKHETESKRMIRAELQRLIKRGKPFSSVDLPDVGGAHDASQVLAEAMKNNEMVKIGRVTVGDHTHAQYIGTPKQENDNVTGNDRTEGLELGLDSRSEDAGAGGSAR